MPRRWKAPRCWWRRKTWRQPEEGDYSYRRSGRAAVVGWASRVVGVVTGVEEYGGPPLLKVEAADGREILIPFARAICKEIDVASKVIRAELPEGLLEISSEVSHRDDFPGVFPGAVRARRDSEGAGSGVDRDSGARFADVDAGPASDGG